jgi:hypothetical protein
MYGRRGGSHMNSLFVLSVLIAVGMVNVARAQMVTYLQGREPEFSVTYPDGWEVRMPRTDGRNVISAYPTDGSMLWLGMWIMKESTSVDDAVERLRAMGAACKEWQLPAEAGTRER